MDQARQPDPRPTRLRAHRRQFVLGPEPWRAHESWQRIQLGPSLWLAHCPELRVLLAHDAEARPWVLLGRAVQSLPDGDPIPDSIRASATSDVPERSWGWAGRWLLIGQDALYTDASALLGCFYGISRRGTCWASSSPALMASLLSGAPESAPCPRRTLAYRTGLPWYPPPESGFADVRRLLPSQALLLHPCVIRPRALMPAIDPGLGTDRVLDRVQESLAITLQRLAAQQPDSEPWLGLTAGYDSRLVLALAANTGVPCRPFTRLAERASVADRILPPHLARLVGYRHVYLPSKHPGNDPARRRLVESHCAGHVSEGDALPFITGARDGLQGVQVGGHGWEAASGWRRFQGVLSNASQGAWTIASHFGEPVDSSATAAVGEWLQWTLDHPHAHLDWRDRFYLEQRHAGWLSSKEQLYDLTDLERFPVLNAASNYALLLGVPESERLKSKLQAKLIKRLAPELLRYPFNPPDAGVASLFQDRT